MAEHFRPSDYQYAHRGLWSPSGPPENSLPAFLAASSRGLGVELDVRPSSDGVPVVFHDPFLDRLTDASGPVCFKTAAELSRLTLSGQSDAHLPTLTDVLAVWPKALPLLIEMKIDGMTQSTEFTNTVASILNAWDGKAALMSFNDIAVASIPDTLTRGLLIAPSGLIGERRRDAAFARAVALGVDYIGSHVSDCETAASFARASCLDIAIWTVDDAQSLSRTKPLNCGLIFEALDPALVAA